MLGIPESAPRKSEGTPKDNDDRSTSFARTSIPSFLTFLLQKRLAIHRLYNLHRPLLRRPQHSLKYPGEPKVLKDIAQITKEGDIGQFGFHPAAGSERNPTPYKASHTCFVSKDLEVGGLGNTTHFGGWCVFSVKILKHAPTHASTKLTLLLKFQFLSTMKYLFLSRRSHVKGRWQMTRYPPLQ